MFPLIFFQDADSCRMYAWIKSMISMDHIHRNFVISSINIDNEGNFDVLLTVHLSIFISLFNQLDAQNLFHNKFYFMPLHFSSKCPRNMQRHEIKLIVKQILCIKLVKQRDKKKWRKCFGTPLNKQQITQAPCNCNNFSNSPVQRAVESCNRRHM